MSADARDDLHSFDVAIVGGGLVGGSLALALAGSGLRLALIETAPKLARVSRRDDDWDGRIYAISPGSAAFLERCEVWPKLDRSRLQPVSDMHIWGDDPDARLDFSAYQAGLPELAFIVENREIDQAIGLALDTQENLCVFRPALCASIGWHADNARIRLQDGPTVEAKLVVGADGGESWVRAQANIPIVARDYAQHGVVANFATEKPHGGIARQWFRRDGVLALLPLPGQRASLVWSTWNDNARRLLDLPEDQFSSVVAEASARVLGKMETISPPRAFPLRLQRLQRLAKARVALVGDAAHNLHPLAGQGVNLGFQDADELSRVLSNRGPQTDCGDYYLLRRYERARKEAVLAMQLTTDALQKLFTSEGRALMRLRNAGLAITDKLAPVKKHLVRHALG